ncbi:MAG TPA: UDP-3-O-(3-hydroxymyristoyl)glucosamine N-acyltransferase [Opitutales bacterium]|nr:UDP-3-O-(3-hydroxymyristoyl)glucosamine N-acyltransferase [Opitutales bacterium]
MSFTIRFNDICELFPDATISGDARPDITGVRALEDAGYGDASFATGVNTAAPLVASRASLIFVPKSFVATPAPGQVFLGVANPAHAISILAELIEKAMRPDPAPGVHPSAFVEADATISPSASVGPLCYVGHGATLGDGSILEAGVRLGRGAVVGKHCHLFPNVVIYDFCVIGDRVRLHSGVVIGADGFGYLQIGALPDVVHYKIPQIGIVVIGNDVEVGANTTIDRARFGETRIGEGTKIDNLTQIAHNCVIGRRCIITSMVGISGSTTIGDYVVMWGQSATAGHLSIGDFAFIGGKAGVTKDVPNHAKVTGTPARPMFEVRKSEAALFQLTEMLPQLKRLVAGMEAPPSDDASAS